MRTTCTISSLPMRVVRCSRGKSRLSDFSRWSREVDSPAGRTQPVNSRPEATRRGTKAAAPTFGAAAAPFGYPCFALHRPSAHLT